jgi:hypothetical protein
MEVETLVTSDFEAMALILLAVAIPLFKRVCTSFDTHSEHEWICFAKAMWEVWSTVHDTVSKHAQIILKPYIDKVKLNPFTVTKIQKHNLVKFHSKETVCTIKQT